MKTTTITFTHTIPLERIADLLICALEGGSNHWITSIEIGKGVSTIEPKSIEDYLQYAIEQDGWSITLRDKEIFWRERKPHYVAYHVTLPKLIAGLRHMAEEHPRHFLNFLNEDEDAETGDVFLQISTFGEVVYG
jgi:hypothetical protein